mgnify:CR=1 FL=1
MRAPWAKSIGIERRRAPFTRRDSLSWQRRRTSSSTRYSQKVTFTCGDALRRRHVIVFEVTAIGTCEENVECSYTRMPLIENEHVHSRSSSRAVLVVFQRRKRNWSRPALSFSLANSLQFVSPTWKSRSSVQRWNFSYSFAIVSVKLVLTEFSRGASV